MVITRFAPSPTGYLHIGSVRTALYSWLYARAHQGKFILRIEDTDRERSTEAAVQVILEGMAFVGLNHDEGPYYQTQRFEHYTAAIKQLLDTGAAYRCYCSKERLATLREAQQRNKEKPRYDGHCRHLAPDAHTQDTPHVIRFRNPETGEVSFDDKVRGRITVRNEELDDLIIARTDGTPTYNLTVVVDDAEMKVTHVIRGDDHINNTPRQINLLNALNVPLPAYAHIPMILGPDGKRLSKRHGAVSILQYRDEGYLPEALLNYLVRLGWSHGDQEIFSVNEMIEKFSLAQVNNSPAAINPEKLIWLNQHYLKTLPAEDIAQRLTHFLSPTQQGPALTDVVIAQRERCKTLVEMAEKSRFFYQDTLTYDEKAVNKHLSSDGLTVLKQLHDTLAALPASDWRPEAIDAVIKGTAESLELKLGKVAQPLRVALTGTTVSPPIGTTLYLLGRDTVLNRIQLIL